MPRNHPHQTAAHEGHARVRPQGASGSYENTYAWFMRFREGLVVEATAFFDSIAFNELWAEISSAD